MGYPEDLLAAAVVVYRRRTGQDTVRLGDGAGGTFAVRLSDDPTLDELCRRLAERTPAEGAPDLRVEPGTGEVRMCGGEAADARVEAQIRQAASALAHRRLRVSDVDLMTPAGLAEVRALAAGVPAPPPRCVHELVAEWAVRTPGATALTAPDGALTYAELVARADDLAARLVAAGVVPDQVVGVWLDRSGWLVTALLGVLRAGGAYLPIDPGSPPERAAALLRDAGVRVVVTGPGDAPPVPPGIRAVPLIEPADRRHRTAPPARVTPRHLAYVSYTSGSTGEPKGVCVPHAAVSRLVRDPDWSSFTSSDVFLQTAPAAFDASTLEIWAPLCNGGRLVLLPPGQIDLDRLGRTVRDEGVTVLWLTAGLFRRVVETQLPRLGGLRQLIAGGDVVAPDAVRRLLRAHPGVTFVNGYGPTENTTFTTCARVRTEPPDGALPIGRPISGTRVAVLDARLRPVPVGVVGELYAGGDGLARGYLARPGATARSFLPDPSPDHPGERLYRTGDLARWRPDGQLDFLGRADRQVKVNGYRVEPAEIEAALAHHPAVTASVVVAQAEPDGGRRLVGYVVVTDPTVVPRLRGWLGTRLPRYLVPSWIVPIDAPPLTANGKIDRDALPPVRRAPRGVDNEYVPPRTPLEHLLCELWADALGLESVGVEDDFFEMGGHSLIAAELLARLEEDYGIRLSAQMLYLSPTVADLVELDEAVPASAGYRE